VSFWTLVLDAGDVTKPKSEALGRGQGRFIKIRWPFANRIVSSADGLLGFALVSAYRLLVCWAHSESFGVRFPKPIPPVETLA
jgi:hypothetical protein